MDRKEKYYGIKKIVGIKLRKKKKLMITNRL
jgi:hypothetical protein